MKPSKETQKEIILEAFNLLKGRFEESWDVAKKLMDAIGKMTKLDMSTATEMMEELISKHLDFLHEEDEENVFSMFMFHILNKYGEEQAWKFITSSEYLKKSYYKECGYLDEFTYDSIGYFAANGEVELANELMGFVYNNKHRKDSWDVIMDRAVWAIGNWCDATNFWGDIEWEQWNMAIEMLSQWANKISDKKRENIKNKIEKKRHVTKKSKQEDTL